MYKICIIFMLSGCLKEFTLDGMGQIDNKLAIIVDNTSYWHENTPRIQLKLIVKPKLSVQALKKRLALIENPTTETLPIGQDKVNVAFILKHDSKNYVLSFSKKTEKKSCYGLYVRNDERLVFRLLHTFCSKPKEPRLVTHDIGQGGVWVSDKRRHFRLTFDQPMQIQPEFNLYFLSLNDHSTVIPERIDVDVDRKNLHIILAENNLLQAGQNYKIEFSGLTNDFADGVVGEPITFLVVKDTDPSFFNQNIKINASDDGVFIQWSLSQAHNAEWFLFNSEMPFFCATNFCPVKKDSVISSRQPALFAHNWLGFYAAKLKAEASYDWLLRLRDMQGRIMIKRGSFTTLKKQSLAFSEILINPKNKDSREETAEFIELFNGGDTDLNLSGLKLLIKDSQGKDEKNCELISNDTVFIVPANSYVVVVGNAFNDPGPPLETSLLVRLKQKTLCGGLANNSPKIMVLHWGDGNFIDSYGSYLWKSPEGQSIQRINLMGLDEPDNYCYSKSVGPTPGRVNGLCT